MIYTFYSYKGGVGRTMALANVAELFYQAGLRVLMVDWDLEAPGLERFFPVHLEEILGKPGVIDMILRYKEQMARELPISESGKESLPFEKPDQFIVDVHPDDSSKGRLWLLPAGRRSKENFAEYAHAVRTFDWQDFYQNWEGELYFEWLRQQFEQTADVVLIDSRTGVTEMGGVCTYQLADTIVMFCTPNQQSIDGTYEMARNFTDPRVQNLRRGRPLYVLIVPARVERVESELLDKFQEDFISLFEDFVPHAIDIQKLWQLGIPYIPKYAFTETVAVRESGRASAEDMVIAFQELSELMKSLSPSLQELLYPLPSEGVQATDADVDFQAELSHLSSARINMIAGTIINIQVAPAAEVLGEVIRNRREAALSRHLPLLLDVSLQEQVDHWFHHALTGDRERFFVVTLSMFNGINYPDFMDIYEIVLQVMSVDEEEKEGKPRPRFAVADDELMNQVRVQIHRSDTGLEEILKFADDRYAAAVFDLMRRRYRYVLFDLLPVLKQLVETHHWEIRYRAVLAIAKIGKMSFHRVRGQVLEPLGNDLRAYVRMAVGYSLAFLAQDEACRSAVENLLADWIDPRWGVPGAWRHRWTAASAYKQIGSIEADWAKDWAYQGLKKLASFDDIRLADAVIHSLVVLSLQGQLERVLLTVKEWIEEGSAGSKEELAAQIRCLVGVLTFMVISEVNIELTTEEKEEASEAGVQVGNLFYLVRQSEAEKGEYWQMVVAVGVRAFEYRLGDGFFDLIARWAQYAANDLTLQNTVRNLLAEVSMQVSPRSRERILNRLSLWERLGDEYLGDIARLTREKTKNDSRGDIISASDPRLSRLIKP